MTAARSAAIGSLLLLLSACSSAPAAPGAPAAPATQAPGTAAATSAAATQPPPAVATAIATVAPTPGRTVAPVTTPAPTAAPTVTATAAVGSVDLTFSGGASLIVKGTQITCSCPVGGGPCDMSITGEQYPDIGTGFYVSHGTNTSTGKWIGGPGALWIVPGEGTIQWSDDKHLALNLKGQVNVKGAMACP